ncbi:hypothetical protein [Nocardia bovistercoris]|uniref:Uncharacterized protein n=1 Tax=Nocardia bovistercoris TaxID=2785916 RepID=A0A931N8F2_9NOCA|nr:hypothetical protein [Nocardia bovistercoris]MBH0781718.1 hypothetical protein [Nocardia bovistercoris]
MDFSVAEFEEVIRNIEERLDGLDSQAQFAYRAAATAHNAAATRTPRMTA